MFIVKILFFCFIFTSITINSITLRNPFSFSEIHCNNINFNGIAKINNKSTKKFKNFAIINIDNNIKIVQPGDNILNYKIIDIVSNYIIIQDENNNELIILDE